MSDVKVPRISDSVIYIDEKRIRRNALVLHVWDECGGPAPGTNLVIVSNDLKEEDIYGRQIERPTSVVHTSVQPAGGNCWCWPDEF